MLLIYSNRWLERFQLELYIFNFFSSFYSSSSIYFFFSSEHSVERVMSEIIRGHEKEKEIYKIGNIRIVNNK